MADLRVGKVPVPIWYVVVLLGLPSPPSIVMDAVRVSMVGELGSW